MRDISKKSALVEYALQNLDELYSLATDLIQIPSENPGGSQQEIIAYVQNYLNNLGLETELVGDNPQHPCLVSSYGEDEGFQLIFNGHLDVVPAGDLDKWDFPPYSGKIQDGKILGRGTSDMKCGVAGFLYAIKVLQEQKQKIPGKIRLHLVSDEETGGQFGTHWLCRHGYAAGADAVIVAEPTSKTIEIGQKGKAELILKSKGASAHGSLGSFKGNNAIMNMYPALEGLNQLSSLTGFYLDSQAQALDNSKRVAVTSLGEACENVIDHVSINVGKITGGTSTNMVPDKCEVSVDVRTPIGLDNSAFEAKIQALLKEHPDISCQIEWMSAPNFTDEHCALVQSVKRNAELLWREEIVPAYQWASSDAHEYRELGIPTIQYGPSNTAGIHSYNEDVDLEDVSKASFIYLMTICDLFDLN